MKEKLGKKSNKASIYNENGDSSKLYKLAKLSIAK